MQNSAAMNEYKQVGRVGTKVAIDSADPHTLVQMLIDGAIERINAAKFALENGNVAVRGENISSAISIIDGLKVSLDMNNGGEIAQNLASLYDYMQRKLLEANVHNKSDSLNEVLSLINEIKSGWQAIPQDVRNSHTSKA